MHKTGLLLMITPFLFSGGGTPVSHADACPKRFTTLAAMRDCARPILLFAQSAQDPLLRAQIEELVRRPSDLQDRQVVVAIVLPANTVSAASLPFSRLTPEEDILARRRFRKNGSGFAFVLIGKDGGEKWRSDRVVSVDEIDRRIDGMPMRQEEMRLRERQP